MYLNLQTGIRLKHAYFLRKALEKIKRMGTIIKKKKEKKKKNRYDYIDS